MKFRFKTQEYQVHAVNNIVSVFAGQSHSQGRKYHLDLGYSALASKATNNVMLAGIDYEQALELGYANSLIELTNEQLLSNIRQVQGLNNIERSVELSDELGACVLDIEMETGTGKTYVYIKTMFELNKAYGWSKFIIVVPSIAIREGVKKSLDITADHFMELYHKKIRSFIYSSDNLNDINDFSQSHDIYVMIINTQAFNSFKEQDKRNSAARIIYSERDSFGSRRPIDVLSNNRPILILDEPQKMAGEATKAALKNFKPLFALNISATHKDKHNTIYQLDALDAYNQKLVKRIEVVGIEVSNLTGTAGYLYLENIITEVGGPPKAVLTFEARTKNGIKLKTCKLGRDANLYELSGKLEAYKGYYITYINAVDGKVKVSTGNVTASAGHEDEVGEIVLEVGQATRDLNALDKARIQIHQTIKSHLEKERMLYGKGIKTLSLFFLETVKHYRDYDAEDNAGIYQHMFEEEYLKVRDELFGNGVLLKEDQDYYDYLYGIDVKSTHAGYFSVDKHKRLVDPEVKKNGDSGTQSDYELILKDKERLLSFAEPVRFIFSHSALREGWDNPNVFQICSLKQSDSTVQKRQEVGRGLRLCVDQNGNRQDVSVLGDQFHDVNLLTVIASESYADFVKGLQSDINQSLYERAKKITPDFFKGKNIEIYEPATSNSSPSFSTSAGSSPSSIPSAGAILDNEAAKEATATEANSNAHQEQDQSGSYQGQDGSVPDQGVKAPSEGLGMGIKHEHVITEEEANDIVLLLHSKKVLDNKGCLTSDFCDRLLSDQGAQGFDLAGSDEEFAKFKGFSEGVLELLTKAHNPKAVSGMIRKRPSTSFSASKLTDNFRSEAFQKLWQKINHKFAYLVDFDSRELIESSVACIDHNLRVSHRVFTITSSKQKSTLTREQYENSATFEKEQHKSDGSSDVISSGVKYDLLGKIAQEAVVTRKTVAEILSRISPNTFDQYKYNPEDFIAQCIKIITNVKASLVVANISYQSIDGKFADEIFTAQHSKQSELNRRDKLTKSVVDQVFVDSQVEKDFLDELESHTEVEVYAKIPRGFSIPTPVGNYSPDWAIVFREGFVQQVHFVVETKGDTDFMQLREVEKCKINCAKKLFAQLSDQHVQYMVVDDYQKLISSVGINKDISHCTPEQLSLVKEYLQTHQ